MLGRSFLLLLLSVFLVEIHAEFNEDSCVECVQSSASVFSNSTIVNSYCEVAPGEFQCILTEEGCDGESYEYTFECDDSLDGLAGLGQAILSVIVVLLCCCCLALVGSIAACVYCCVRGSGPPPPGVPGAYYANGQPQQAVAATATTTTTTPAQTGLATAVEPPPPQQSSIPFAEAVSVEK